MINRILRGFPPRRLCVKFFSKFLFSQVPHGGPFLPCEAGCYATAFAFPPEAARRRPEAGGLPSFGRGRSCGMRAFFPDAGHATSRPARILCLDMPSVRQCRQNFFPTAKKRVDPGGTRPRTSWPGAGYPFLASGDGGGSAMAAGKPRFVTEQNDSCETWPRCRRMRFRAEKQAALSKNQIGRCPLPEKTRVLPDAGQKGQPGKPGRMFRPWFRGARAMTFPGYDNATE